MASRPRDECPYHKPFKDSFDECPAYQPAQFVALNTHYEALPWVWTCSHLDLRSYTAGSHRYYARCRLGDQAARLRWVNEVQQGRLLRLRRLQDEMVPITSGYAQELWSIKGRQLQAMRDDRDTSSQVAELRAVAQRYMDQIGEFFEQRRALLDELHLPMDALMELFRVIFEQWIAQPNAEIPKVPEEVLGRFPEDVRVLLRPTEAA